MGRKNSTKKKNKGSESAGKTFKGTLDITRSGMGFVIVPDMETDILIRPNQPVRDRQEGRRRAAVSRQ